jgi:hypothetical protein
MNSLGLRKAALKTANQGRVTVCQRLMAPSSMNASRANNNYYNVKSYNTINSVSLCRYLVYIQWTRRVS